MREPYIAVMTVPDIGGLYYLFVSTGAYIALIAVGQPLDWGLIRHSIFPRHTIRTPKITVHQYGPPQCHKHSWCFLFHLGTRVGFSVLVLFP